MARSPVTFQSAFDAACVACGNFTAAQVVANAALQTTLLRYFNRSYQVGYDTGPPDGWEDGRVGSDITPVDRLIDYSTLGDARSWQIFNDDPRGTDDAWELPFTTNASGILLREDPDGDTVWVTWQPEVIKFTTTEWVTATAYAVGDVRLLGSSGACYRCLVAHTSGTFATDLASSYWVLVPVLSILEEFTIAHMQGMYLRENGQAETGFAMERAAISALEDKSLREAQRLSQAGCGQVWGSCHGSGTGNSGGGSTTRYIRYDTSQSLTAAQRSLARENAGITQTLGGYWEFVDENGTHFHIPLNIGAAPG